MERKNTSIEVPSTKLLARDPTPEAHDYAYVRSGKAVFTRDAYEIWECSKCGKRVKYYYIDENY